MKMSLLLLLVSTSLSAKEHLYRVGEKSYLMVYKDGVLANRDCFKVECQAFTAARATKKQQLQMSISGLNPNSLRCKHLLKGEVIIGFDSAGNEESFCQFPDGSLISCQSLTRIP